MPGCTSTLAATMPPSHDPSSVAWVGVRCAGDRRVWPAGGYTFANFDGGYWADQQLRGPDGKITPDPARFPSGLAAIADYVHTHKMKQC